MPLFSFGLGRFDRLSEGLDLFRNLEPACRDLSVILRFILNSGGIRLSSSRIITLTSNLCSKSAIASRF